MSELATLVEEVQISKKEYLEYLEEHGSTSNTERYKELSKPSYRKPLVNRVYRAVRALSDYMQKETGLTSYQFSDLFSSYGYMGNPDEE